MAEVRVQGSGERAFSDGTGHYLLAGLEIGDRTVQFSARGHEALSQAVNLDHPGVVQVLDVALSTTS